MEKKFLQSCTMGGSIYGKKGVTPKRAGHKDIVKKDVVEVYNKFYKDQVSALYRAIHGAS